MLRAYEKTLFRWFNSELGREIWRTEKHWLVKHLPLITGNVALQWGGTPDWLDVSPIKKRFILYQDDTLFSPEESIQIDYRILPLMPNSIDCILISHMLEGLDQPWIFLQEAYQALAPDGKLILFHFNPYSFWIFKRLSSKIMGDATSLMLPIEHHSMGQMKRWLHSCGYRIIISESLFFRPLINQLTTPPRFLWMEAVGSFLFPGLGAVSVILAEKSIEGMTPLRAWECLKKVNLYRSYSKAIVPN